MWWSDEEKLTFHVPKVLGDTTFLRVHPADLQKIVITNSCIHLFTVENQKTLTFKLMDFEFIQKLES